MSSSPEVIQGGVETGVEARSAAAERSAELAKTREKGIENSPENQAEAAEKALAEANKEALMSKERGGAEKKTSHQGSGPRVIRDVTKKEKEAAYKKTLKEIRTEMNAPSRVFSKIIHNPVVEKTSEALGATVARPNAIVAGGLSACILVTSVLIIAKIYGYPLSGFEPILAFIVGWVLGLIYDYFRAMFTGGKKV